MSFKFVLTAWVMDAEPTGVRDVVLRWDVSNEDESRAYRRAGCRLSLYVDCQSVLPSLQACGMSYRDRSGIELPPSLQACGMSYRDRSGIELPPSLQACGMSAFQC